ncbi:Serine/threonine-protein kinase par-1 [Actinomortierella ambigua]|uniref:Serine/threonine-protein kinase par-1 n=1 Tax=Actinomortierella ambigua TaxID=1343610 RepID=A0A9P6QK70_9FUNG|nr:Serine/threonine-protein kinase par-1 [Actinomortierella ambigua]
MTTSPSPDASLPGIAHYAFLRQLGHGKFCVVHLARHFYTEKLYAVKVIDKQAHRADILSRLRREIGLMESLDHPNIVKLYEVIETQFTIYVCMEYVEGWSLEEYLKTHEDERLSESEARSILRQLCRAVSHCHERKVVHRDIKPANILITPTNKVMLIDFGLGNVYSRRQRLNTICGSLPFYSPEIARGVEYTGPEIDIWCLGVVLYRMTVGRDPFVGDTKREVKRQIMSEMLPQPNNVSPACFQTITKLLAPKGTDRQSLTILERDPWLTHHGLKPFFSEYRHDEERRSSRLSGATLVHSNSGGGSSSKGASQLHLLDKKSSYYSSNSSGGGGLTGTGSTTGIAVATTRHGGGAGSASTIGARSWTVENRTWQVEKGAPFPMGMLLLPKAHSKIRIVPTSEAEADMLYLRDDGLSLLQFLMPILRSAEISYYLHSTTRILCGMAFQKSNNNSSSRRTRRTNGFGDRTTAEVLDNEKRRSYRHSRSLTQTTTNTTTHSSAAVGAAAGGAGAGAGGGAAPFQKSVVSSAEQLFQKMVRQIGRAMTAGSMVQQAEPDRTRYGVFSIDIVKAGKTADQGYVLVTKRILGSPKTLRQFRKVFMLHATH